MYANNIKSCFQQLKHHPDVMGTFAFIIEHLIILQCILSFGIVVSMLNYKLIWRIAQLATLMVHNHHPDQLWYDTNLQNSKLLQFIVCSLPAQQQTHANISLQNFHSHCLSSPDNSKLLCGWKHLCKHLQGHCILAGCNCKYWIHLLLPLGFIFWQAVGPNLLWHASQDDHKLPLQDYGQNRYHPSHNSWIIVWIIENTLEFCTLYTLFKNTEVLAGILRLIAGSAP